MDVNKRIQSNLCRMSTRFPSSGIIELSTIPVMRPLSTTLIRERIIVSHPCVEEVNYCYYELLWTTINHYQPLCHSSMKTSFSTNITYCKAETSHGYNQLVRFRRKRNLNIDIDILPWLLTCLDRFKCSKRFSIYQRLGPKGSWEVSEPSHSLKEVVRLVFITAKLSEWLRTVFVTVFITVYSF